ncbi:hypothetical protein WK13_34610 [Burkholderia ubonensis]|uniref:hypothetical protein n=1 Tax=Burkholderia ubonensis TaxID=101571 RepID=UPI000759DDAE|nr:hypothetical protein [Burkholderia ubonensis]KVR21672.1 hypothetical protein WK13_34610 [Burkholderia ubonensis]
MSGFDEEALDREIEARHVAYDPTGSQVWKNEAIRDVVAEHMERAEDFAELRALCGYLARKTAISVPAWMA